MKLLFVLTVCVAAAAAASLVPNVHKVGTFDLTDSSSSDAETKSVLINALIRQFFTYLRYVITNGSYIFGIPPLDPLMLESYHLLLPAGLINLDLSMKNVDVKGVGSFVVNKSQLDLAQMTFDIDISIPVLDIKAGEYDLDGDLFTAIPLYGKGDIRFTAEGYRFKGTLHLKQSENGNAIIIRNVTNSFFEVPSVKSEMTGVIGGGDFDAIANAFVEDILFGYISRFHGAISHGAARVVPLALNPILEQLNTWSYIEPFLPRS